MFSCFLIFSVDSSLTFLDRRDMMGQYTSQGSGCWHLLTFEQNLQLLPKLDIYIMFIYSFLCPGAARFALADLTFPKSLAWWLFLGCTQLFSDDTSHWPRHRVELQSQVFTSWFVCVQAPTRPLIALCDWLQFLSHRQIFKLLVQQLHMSHYFDIPLMPLDEWKVITAPFWSMARRQILEHWSA